MPPVAFNSDSQFEMNELGMLVLKQNIQQWKSILGHQLWRDDVSVCVRVRFPELPNAKHLTDCFLLALAVKRGGKFVTFDRRIDTAWVFGGALALMVLDSLIP
jgi:predicted nucleic acid-binding protein